MASRQLDQRCSELVTANENSPVTGRSENTASEAVRYLNLMLSEKGIAELDGKHCAVFIPKEQVKSIEVRHGRRSERPLMQGVGGVVLIGLGVVGVRMIVAEGVVTIRWSIGFLVFGGLGVWMMWEAFRRGNYLHVACAKESRKLKVVGEVRDDELQSFARKATELGYDIRDGLNQDD